MLCVAHFFVHETVNEGYAAVNRKGHGQFLIGPRKTWSTRFVAQLGYSQHVLAVFDGETQYVPVSSGY